MASKAPTEADIRRNQSAVKEARDQRLVQSWLSPRPAGEEEGATSSQKAYDDEKDFEGFMDELGGVGSKRKVGDEDDIVGSLKRSKVARDDKLLERLIGRKGADAMRQERKEAQHVASKPRTVGVKAVKGIDAREDEEEDEEGGRAGAFQSKRQKKAVVEEEATAEHDEADGEDEETRAATTRPAEKTATQPTRTNKAKPTSYLDEMLSQRGSKKKKKKKKKPSKPTATEISP